VIQLPLTPVVSTWILYVCLRLRIIHKLRYGMPRQRKRISNVPVCIIQLLRRIPKVKLRLSLQKNNFTSRNAPWFRFNPWNINRTMRYIHALCNIFWQWQFSSNVSPDLGIQWNI